MARSASPFGHSMENFTVADVSAWLRRSGLGELCPMFAKEKVNGHVLVRLNDSNLVELGISNSIQRLRLLQAVREECASSQSLVRRSSDSEDPVFEMEYAAGSRGQSGGLAPPQYPPALRRERSMSDADWCRADRGLPAPPQPQHRWRTAQRSPSPELFGPASAVSHSSSIPFGAPPRATRHYSHGSMDGVGGLHYDHGTPGSAPASPPATRAAVLTRRASCSDIDTEQRAPDRSLSPSEETSGECAGNVVLQVGAQGAPRRLTRSDSCSSQRSVVSVGSALSKNGPAFAQPQQQRSGSSGVVHRSGSFASSSSSVVSGSGLEDSMGYNSHLVEYSRLNRFMASCKLELCAEEVVRVQSWPIINFLDALLSNNVELRKNAPLYSECEAMARQCAERLSSEAYCVVQDLIADLDQPDFAADLEKYGLRKKRLLNELTGLLNEMRAFACVYSASANVGSSRDTARSATVTSLDHERFLMRTPFQQGSSMQPPPTPECVSAAMQRAAVQQPQLPQQPGVLRRRSFSSASSGSLEGGSQPRALESPQLQKPIPSMSPPVAYFRSSSSSSQSSSALGLHMVGSQPFQQQQQQQQQQRTRSSSFRRIGSSSSGDSPNSDSGGDGSISPDASWNLSREGARQASGNAEESFRRRGGLPPPSTPPNRAPNKVYPLTDNPHLRNHERTGGGIRKNKLREELSQARNKKLAADTDGAPVVLQSARSRSRSFGLMSSSSSSSCNSSGAAEAGAGSKESDDLTIEFTEAKRKPPAPSATWSNNPYALVSPSPRASEKNLKYKRACNLQVDVSPLPEQQNENFSNLGNLAPVVSPDQDASRPGLPSARKAALGVDIAAIDSEVDMQKSYVFLGGEKDGALHYGDLVIGVGGVKGAPGIDALSRDANKEAAKLVRHGAFSHVLRQQDSSGAVNNPGIMQSGLRILGPLGKGAGGTVCKGIHVPTLRIVAVKEVLVNNRSQRKQMLRELETLLTGLTHPNLVSFYDSFWDPRTNTASLVFEYVQGGSLQDIVDQGKPVAPDKLGRIALDVLRGLEYLHHEKKQVHRDIKPSNLLITACGTTKIADFGISRALESTEAHCNTYLGTVMYMSPERIENANYTIKADMWSLSMVLMTLALGRFPFNVRGYWNLNKCISEEAFPSLPGCISPEFVDIVMRGLERDPANRPNAKELLETPVLGKIAQREDEQAASRASQKHSLTDSHRVVDEKAGSGLEKVAEAVQAHYREVAKKENHALKLDVAKLKALAEQLDLPAYHVIGVIDQSLRRLDSEVQAQTSQSAPPRRADALPKQQERLEAVQ